MSRVSRFSICVAGYMGTNCSFAAGLKAFFHGDGDLATRTMLDNTVMFGLES